MRALFAIIAVVKLRLALGPRVASERAASPSEECEVRGEESEACPTGVTRLPGS